MPYFGEGDDRRETYADRQELRTPHPLREEAPRVLPLRRCSRKNEALAPTGFFALAPRGCLPARLIYERSDRESGETVRSRATVTW